MKRFKTYLNNSMISYKNRMCFLESIIESEEVLASFFDDRNYLSYKQSSYNYKIELNSGEVDYYSIDNVRCGKIESPLNYLLQDVSYNKLSIMLLLYPLTNPVNNEVLFKLNSDNGVVTVSINSSGKVCAILDEVAGFITTVNSVNLNEWNYLSLSLEINDLVLNGRLGLNREYLINSKNVNRENICKSNISFNIGNNNESFTGYLTGLNVCKNIYITNEEDLLYYLKLKEHIINKVENSSNKNVLYYDAVNYYNNDIDAFSKNYDCIPLNGTFTSFKGINPVYISSRHSLIDDSFSNFRYDKEKERLVYQAMGNVLSYDFGFTSSGTIVLDFKIDEINTSNYILSFSNDESRVSLHVSNNKLYLGINNQHYNTEIDIYKGVWHTLSLRFKLNEVDVAHTFNVSVDGNSYSKIVYNDITLDNMEFYLGINIYGSVKYPLYGDIDMIVYSPDYYSDTDLESIINKRVVKTYIKKYDEFMHIVSNDDVRYEYLEKAESQAHTYETLTNLIIKEEVSFDGTVNTYEYGYDNSLNVSSIKENGNELRLYTYNHLGELIKEELKEKNYAFEYQYDSLGNRTKKLKIINGHTFVIEENTFDEANRIISTSSGDITYNSYNELSRATLGGSIFDLEWEAKKLVSLSLSAAHTFKYEYNFYGQRTKKIEEVAGAFKYTYYYYNGDKLVKEKVVDDIKGEEYEVTYLYDSASIAKGFIYNNKEYKYIRDILGCINKIVDSNNNVVGSYCYDAFGYIIEVSSSLCNINSIKYKGYYYDRESGLYFCNSRYYNPEWGRWISVDDVDYLDPESINGLNLYCYCMNNPVMYVDPSGHVATSTLIISVIIGAITNVAIEYYDYKKGQEKDTMDYVAAALGGAISGLGVNFIGAFFLGAIGEMVETLFSGEATEHNMYSTFLNGAISGIIGFGIGEAFKYLACVIETGVGKVLAKIISNNKTNRILAAVNCSGIKIGTKNFGKLVKGFAGVEGNTFADIVSASASGGYACLENYFVTHAFLQN